MNILFICIVIFIAFMAAGFAGLFAQTRLTETHKTGESKAVVGQISGLVSLLLALALSRCHAKSASGPRLTDFQAAATASCHVVIAAARSTRCDLADVRWRWTLNVL